MGLFSPRGPGSEAARSWPHKRRTRRSRSPTRGLSENKETTAETIENNIRKIIIDKMAVNPKYFEKMSDLLDELILARKQQALEYRVYLERIVDLAINVDQGIQQVKKAEWRDNKFKERGVRNSIKSVLGDDEGLVNAIFEIVIEPKNGYRT